MADLPNSASDDSRRQYLARTVRTFVAVCWVSWSAIVIGISTLGVSRLPPIPSVVFWLALPTVILVSTLVTGWLVNGGYDRLGANPDAAGRFGWLAFLYVPVALLPTQVALDTAGVVPTDGFVIVIVGGIVLAGWLAVFDGSSRVGIETRYAAHAAGAAVALYAVGSVVGPSAVPDRFLTSVWIGAAAVAAQVAALWLGLGGYVDRVLA